MKKLYFIFSSIGAFSQEDVSQQASDQNQYTEQNSDNAASDKKPPSSNKGSINIFDENFNPAEYNKQHPGPTKPSYQDAYNMAQERNALARTNIGKDYVPTFRKADFLGQNYEVALAGLNNERERFFERSAISNLGKFGIDKSHPQYATKLQQETQFFRDSYNASPDNKRAYYINNVKDSKQYIRKIDHRTIGVSKDTLIDNKLGSYNSAQISTFYSKLSPQDRINVANPMYVDVDMQQAAAVGTPKGNRLSTTPNLPKLETINPGDNQLYNTDIDMQQAKAVGTPKGNRLPTAPNLTNPGTIGNNSIYNSAVNNFTTFPPPIEPIPSHPPVVPRPSFVSSKFSILKKLLRR